MKCKLKAARILMDSGFFCQANMKEIQEKVDTFQTLFLCTW